MSMPSNNKIEDRALGVLRNIIDDHATMGHEFHSMDKEMSWDGYIWIYKDINGTQGKTSSALSPIFVPPYPFYPLYRIFNRIKPFYLFLIRLVDLLDLHHNESSTFYFYIYSLYS